MNNINNEVLLFTTGIDDECIMKWRMELEGYLQDKDYKNNNTEENDYFSEVKPADKFQNDCENILTIRQELNEIKDQVDYT